MKYKNSSNNSIYVQGHEILPNQVSDLSGYCTDNDKDIRAIIQIERPVMYIVKYILDDRFTVYLERTYPAPAINIISDPSFDPLDLVGSSFTITYILQNGPEFIELHDTLTFVNYTVGAGGHSYAGTHITNPDDWRFYASISYDLQDNPVAYIPGAPIDSLPRNSQKILHKASYYMDDNSYGSSNRPYKDWRLVHVKFNTQEYGIDNYRRLDPGAEQYLRGYLK